MNQKAKDDSATLKALLASYAAKKDQENYKVTVQWLINQDSILLVPTPPSEIPPEGQRTIHPGETLKFFAFDMDGLKVVGAFTDEEALLRWAKKPYQYVAMSSKDFLKIAEENGIERVIINSDSEDMFVLEKGNSFQTETIKEPEKVLMGMPAKPLDPLIVGGLKQNFEKVSTIEEAYIYQQSRGDRLSLVIAILLNIESNESHKAALNAVQKVLDEKKPKREIDIMMIKEGSDIYDGLKKMEGSLIYKKIIT